MNRDDLANHLALGLCDGIGPVSYQRIIERFPTDPAHLFKLSTAALKDLGFNDKQIDGLANPPWQLVETSLAWLESAPAHHILVKPSPDYPKLLAEINNPPPVLFALGDVDLLETPQIAMVGSRNCTASGRDTARDFAAYLSAAGLTITSGMAQGIDSHAHRGALQAGGHTIAVVGTGIDRIYPSSNRRLAHEIAEQGLIVSEFPLGTPPLASNFPKRNRIISGLSLGTLVVEAARNSGSLITARLSNEQGREVFAIPGSIHNPHARGCHQLIRDGAKLVDQAADIIEDIGGLLGFVAQQIDTTRAEPKQPLDAEYTHLLEVMGYDPISIDRLVERSGLTVEQLSSMLLILELNDQIQPAPGGLYVRR